MVKSWLLRREMFVLFMLFNAITHMQNDVPDLFHLHAYQKIDGSYLPNTCSVYNKSNCKSPM